MSLGIGLHRRRPGTQFLRRRPAGGTGGSSPAPAGTAPVAGAVPGDDPAVQLLPHQKDILLREMHHCLKNNLQLIASIINLHIRDSDPGDGRQMLRTVQDRIISLALVHGDLYLAPDFSEVHVNRLLPRIVHQVIAMVQGTNDRISLEMSIADLAVTPAQAAPLALLLAEAVANARNQIPAAGGPHHVSVIMNRTGPDHASLVVAHAVTPAALTGNGLPMGTGLGRQLIHAFAAQLEGEVCFSESPESQRMELRFPVGAGKRWQQEAIA